MRNAPACPFTASSEFARTRANAVSSPPAPQFLPTLLEAFLMVVLGPRRYYHPKLFTNPVGTTHKADRGGGILRRELVGHRFDAVDFSLAVPQLAPEPETLLERLGRLHHLSVQMTRPSEIV